MYKIYRKCKISLKWLYIRFSNIVKDSASLIENFCKLFKFISRICQISIEIFLHFLGCEFLSWHTDAVMMPTTRKPASLMEEIAVEVLLIQIIAQNVYALKEGEVKLQLAEAAIRDG